MLTLAILLGVAGVILVHQWLAGSLDPEQSARGDVLEPASFPHLAPARRTPVAPHHRRRMAA